MFKIENYFFAAGAEFAAGDAGATGAVEALDAGGVAIPSNTLLRVWVPNTVSIKDVDMKIAAITLVKRVKKLAPPELPKTVWLDPPKEVLISAPFPDWISTTKINKIAVVI